MILSWKFLWFNIDGINWLLFHFLSVREADHVGSLQVAGTLTRNHSGCYPAWPDELAKPWVFIVRVA